jgi:hypothetical protein
MRRIHLKKSYRRNRLLDYENLKDLEIEIEEPWSEEIETLKKTHHPEYCKKCNKIHWLPDRMGWPEELKSFRL